MNNIKKNAVITAAAVIVSLTIGFMLGALYGNRKTLPAGYEKQPETARDFILGSEDAIFLTGDNGYNGIIKYYSPDSKGIMSKMILIMFKDGRADFYNMAPTLSASGAKFSALNTDFVLWESHGEFNFYKGDAEILLSTLKEAN